MDYKKAMFYIELMNRSKNLESFKQLIDQMSSYELLCLPEYATAEDAYNSYISVKEKLLPDTSKNEEHREKGLYLISKVEEAYNNIIKSINGINRLGETAINDEEILKPWAPISASDKQKDDPIVVLNSEHLSAYLANDINAREGITAHEEPWTSIIKSTEHEIEPRAHKTSNESLFTYPVNDNNSRQEVTAHREPWNPISESTKPKREPEIVPDSGHLFTYPNEPEEILDFTDTREEVTTNDEEILEPWTSIIKSSESEIEPRAHKTSNESIFTYPNESEENSTHYRR